MAVIGNPMRRRLLLAAPLAAGVAPRAARAQAWPTRSLRMVVGFPPGGAVDIAARVIADLLGPRLGQPVVLENRPGGSGTIGVTAVAQAAPDGYTLGAVAVNSLSIHPYLFARLPYDPERDLLPVSLAWEAPQVLVVPAAHVPARTVAELAAWARRRRGGVSFGSSGVGTTVHLSGELFCRRAGIDGVHVPFRGGSEALTSLLRGDFRLRRGQRADGAAQHPERGVAAARRHLGRTVARPAGGADDGGGRRARPGRHLLGRGVRAGGDGGTDRRAPVGGDARHRGGPGSAGEVPTDRQPPARHDAGGSGGARGAGTPDVAGLVRASGATLD